MARLSIVVRNMVAKFAHLNGSPSYCGTSMCNVWRSGAGDETAKIGADPGADKGLSLVAEYMTLSSAIILVEIRAHNSWRPSRAGKYFLHPRTRASRFCLRADTESRKNPESGAGARRSTSRSSSSETALSHCVRAESVSETSDFQFV